MRPRSVAYFIVALAIAVFVAANWSVVTHPTPINFLIGAITAPLGFLILVIALLVVGIAMLSHAFARLSWRQERRTLTQELERQRQRADHADESRVRELRDFLAQETGSIREQLERVLASLSRK
jgi:uncharacterized integral membrane protein